MFLSDFPVVAIITIINHEVFRKYISRFVAPVVAGLAFRCINGQRSWEFLDLGGLNVESASDAHIRMNPKQATKGIFIWPHERFGILWDVVRKNPNFLRQGVISSKSIMRLEPGTWVDDEIINGYINLLDHKNKPTTLALNTFFYQFLCDHIHINPNHLIAQVCCSQNLLSDCH